MQLIIFSIHKLIHWNILETHSVLISSCPKSVAPPVFSHQLFLFNQTLLITFLRSLNFNWKWLISNCWFRDVCLHKAGLLTCWKSHGFSCWHKILSVTIYSVFFTLFHFDLHQIAEISPNFYHKGFSASELSDNYAHSVTTGQLSYD